MRQNKGKQAKRNTKKTLEQSKLVVDSRGGWGSQDFSKAGCGEGGTQCSCKGTHQIVLSFSPPAVGCFLKKGLQRGAHRHLKTPPPLATSLDSHLVSGAR